MRIEYVSVASGDVLDTITVFGTVVTYQTGKARPMVDNQVAAGRSLADVVEGLRSWSNGYVLTREAEQA